MGLHTSQVQYMRAVADAAETAAGQGAEGTWSPSASMDYWHVLQTTTDSGDVHHIAALADRKEQRLFVTAQPNVLRTVIAAIRLVDTATPDDLATTLLRLCDQYNDVMSLRVAPADVNV